MKKKFIISSLLLCLIAGCSEVPTSTSVLTRKSSINNGGFESGNLNGWTVEWGNAYDDDSVSSRKTFSFKEDLKYNEISINHTGNWYLSGKGYDLSKSNYRTGSIRSNNFYLKDDGLLSFKLAGGSLKRGKGESAADKPEEELCFLGVYRAKDDRMIARQTNDYFIEHTDSYVDASKYENGVYSTDNFNEYELDLSSYIDEELYIRVVDNDKDVYYGYLSVDDIRVGSDALPQEEGTYYVKTPTYNEAVKINDNEIINGDFEVGSLSGWEIVSGNAFSNEGVNSEEVWWNENITYNRDGNYHYGHYNPSATGVMRSSKFVLGGSGYISYKLGGCSNNSLTYLRFMVEKEDGDIEVARYSNFKYWNFQFPYVPNGMKLLNMVQYYTDLSSYIGETMYIEVVDENTSSDELGCITLDSVKTYHETKPVWYTTEAFEAKVYVDKDALEENIYQVQNGGFETGNLDGWTLSGNIGVVSNASGWWYENFPYNKKGQYVFTGVDNEIETGVLRSSSFKLGGSGYISFLFGGASNPKECYISIFDNDTNKEVARYANAYFNDLGTDSINKGSNLLNMIQYKADLSNYLGKNLRIEVVDNATAGWGLVAVDQFDTYYENINDLPSKALLAHNMLEDKIIDESRYQINNGNFEKGNLDGWTKDGDDILGVSSSTVWWIENFSFEKEGTYFASGWNVDEANMGSLTSTSFEVGGSGFISFKLGGGKDTSLCHLEILDAQTNEVLAIYGNTMFKDLEYPYIYNVLPNVLSKDGYYLANMVEYKANLNSFMGRNIKIKIVDNAESDWGLLFVDNIITYYEQISDVPSGAYEAVNLKENGD